jgi:hypothetical protein
MRQIDVLLQTLLLIIISEDKYFALLLLFADQYNNCVKAGEFLIVDRQ